MLWLVFVILVSWSWFVNLNWQADTVTYVRAQNAPESQHSAPEKATTTKDDTYTVKEINELITRYAVKYDVNGDVMREVIQCESQYDPHVQSRKTYDNGAQEESYGIAQIHLPDHPQVSKAEARNPEYAVKFMAQHFAAGNHHLWTCYNRIYGS